MTVTYHGNFVHISTTIGDVSGKPITLKDGYSIDTMVTSILLSHQINLNRMR